MRKIEYSPSSGVIVTGGGSGIGRACVMALAEAGRPVSAWDLNGAGAEESAADAAARFDVPTDWREIDVRDSSGFASAIDQARAAMGSIGGLVHAAGIAGTMPVDVLDEAAWDAVLNVNLRAEAFLVKALIDDLRAAKPGSAVVGIASIEAIVGNGLIPAYCSSKAGLTGLTRSLAHRFAGEGIRINAVCPGAVDTPMLAPLLRNEAMAEQFFNAVPLRRAAQPSEIAKAVRFLLSDDASYITGECLVVDGGMTTSHG